MHRVFILVLLAVVAAAQSTNHPTFKVLHSFGGGSDGQNPTAGLIQDSQGNLYGTTENGGKFGGGTVFRVSPSGVETVLYSFGGTGNDGIFPAAPLVADGAGNFYGTTLWGGIHHSGTVFKLSASGQETVVYSFLNGSDGSEPEGGLVLDSSGRLYGTTSLGGGTYCDQVGCGILFSIGPDGSESIVHTFLGGPDGGNPVSGVFRDDAGNLWGTTPQGGWFDSGLLYKIDSNGLEELFYSFNGPPKGIYPYGGLIRDAAGNLYGTTSSGGASAVCGLGCGSVFKMSPSGVETVLHSFSEADGDTPYSNVVRDNSGNLYGTAFGGGNPGCFFQLGCGTVFELSAPGKFTTLHKFTGGSDGGGPRGGVIVDSAGNVYGTTYLGGANNAGVVFELTP